MSTTLKVIKDLKKKYKLGKAQPQWKCCREVRLINAKEVGEIMQGFNTTTEQSEMWVVIKLDKKPFNSILQKLVNKAES